MKHGLIGSRASQQPFTSSALHTTNCRPFFRPTFASARRLALAFLGLLAALVVARVEAQSTNAAYGLFKGKGYWQFTDSMSMADPNRTAYWECWVRPTQTGVSSETTVLSPLSETESLVADAEGERLLLPFPSQAMCDASFPAGAYALMNVLDGDDRTVNLTLPATGYPPVPLFVSVAAITTPPAGQPLDVNWQPFTGAGPNDLIQVSLEDIWDQPLWHTPWPGQTGALGATNTHCTIPSRYLVGNTNTPYYYLRISFIKVSTAGDGGYPGSKATAGLVSTTRVMIYLPVQQGGDVAEYRLLGGQVWRQATNGTPVPATGTNAWLFEAVAIGTDGGRVTNAVVQTPASQVLHLTPGGDDRMLLYQAAFPSETSWQQAVPLGTYQWTFHGAVEGEQHAGLNFGAASWPPAPVIVGVAQLQAGAFTNDFVLQWNPISGATTNDLIEVAIVDRKGNVSWSYPDPATGDAPLNGTRTSLTVPSGSVVGGRDYEGRVRFLKVQVRDTDSLAGATGLSARFAETRFPLATLSARPLEVLTTNLAPGAVGKDYSEALACDGGRWPVTWAITQGSLPRGVQLDAASGAVTGIPATNGTFNLTVRVSDNYGQAASRAMSLVVTGTVPPLELATTNLPPVIPGIAYFAELAVGGGVPPYQWTITSGTLPAGIELQGCCGQIAGKPTQAGLFAFQLRLQDGAGQTQQCTLSLNVPPSALEPLLRITSAARHGDGRIALGVNGATNDPLTVEASDDLRVWTPRLTTNLPASRLLEFADPAPGRRFYRVRFGWDGAAPDPILVQPVLNTNVTVSAAVDASGATLRLTNGAGVVFALNLPTNSVLVPTTVTMTLVQSLAGQPFTNGLIRAVELRPEGLHLFKPGTLTITFPGGAPADFTAFSYGRGGRDFHLYPAFARSGQVVLPIHHFSGHGGGNATTQQAANTVKRPPCLPMSQGEQEVGKILRDSYPDMPPASALQPPITAWYNQSVLPHLKAAEENDALLDDAAAEFLWWAAMNQLLGLGDGMDPKALQSLANGLANAINRANARCVTDSNLGEIPNMFRLVKNAQLLGLESYYPDVFNTEELADRISRCARFELTLESLIDLDGGKFFEQVRSQPAHIQWDPSTMHYTIADTVGMNLVFWHMENEGGRVRPEVGKGKLHIGYLNIFREESDSDEQPPDPGDPCAKPAPDNSPPKIFCFFTLADPVTGIWFQDADGNWHLQPLTGDMGGRWQPLFKVAHLEEFMQFPDFSGSGEPVEGYGVKDRWDYFGKRLFARATYEGPVAYSGGKADEVTTLELRHAPLPLRKGK